jgi:hypothetical protein
MIDNLFYRLISSFFVQRAIQFLVILSVFLILLMIVLLPYVQNYSSFANRQKCQKEFELPMNGAKE